MSCNVTLVSRITRDPELRYTQSGMAIAEFAVVENRKFGDKEESSFIDVKAWGKTAEFVSKYFKKGDIAYVNGRLTQESWEDKSTGTKRSKLIVTAENIEFVPGTGSSQKDSPAPQQSTKPVPAKSGPGPQQRQTRQSRPVSTPKPAQRQELPPMGGGDDDEDVPF